MKNYTQSGRSMIEMLGVLAIEDFKNPFGGELILRTGATGTSFFVINPDDQNIPPEACADILSADWGNSSLFWGMNVTSSSNSTDYSYSGGTYPMDVSAAINACKGKNKYVSLFFR